MTFARLGKRGLVRALRVVNRRLSRWGWGLSPRLPDAAPDGVREALHDPGVMLLFGMSVARQLTIVTVGAGYVDGTDDADPAIEFLRHFPDRVARAVLVEPIPQRLAATRNLLGSDPRFEFVDSAIGTTGGPMTLWQITPEADEGLRGIGAAVDASGASAAHGWTSADREHVVGLVAQSLGVSRETAMGCVQRVVVPAESLSDVTGRLALHHVDYLQVDTEGFDDDVILSLDLSDVAPSVIRCEFVHLATDRRSHLVQHLAAAGYGPPTQMGALDALFVRVNGPEF